MPKKLIELIKVIIEGYKTLKKEGRVNIGDLYVLQEREFLLDGKKVQRIRGEKGMSMHELSDLARIERTYLWQIETSYHQPRSDVIKALAKGLDVKVKDICKYED